MIGCSTACYFTRAGIGSGGGAGSFEGASSPESRSQPPRANNKMAATNHFSTDRTGFQPPFHSVFHSLQHENNTIKPTFPQENYLTTDSAYAQSLVCFLTFVARCPRPSLPALHLLPKLRAAGGTALFPVKLRPFRLARASGSRHGQPAQLPGTTSGKHGAGEESPRSAEDRGERDSAQARYPRLPEPCHEPASL